MEELMNRIANALEKVEAIKNTGDANAQQYQKLRQELATDIKKALQERPTVETYLDAEKFATHVLPPLVAGLPDTGQLQATGAELISQIKAERERIPTKIAIQGDFWGFTSWKPLAAYTAILVGSLLYMGVCWHEKQETVQYQQNLELLKQTNYYSQQIEEYRNNNPNYSNLFPPYDDGGYWSKFKNNLTPPKEKE